MHDHDVISKRTTTNSRTNLKVRAQDVNPYRIAFYPPGKIDLAQAIVTVWQTNANRMARDVCQPCISINQASRRILARTSILARNFPANISSSRSGKLPIALDLLLSQNRLSVDMSTPPRDNLNTPGSIFSPEDFPPLGSEFSPALRNLTLDLDTEISTNTPPPTI